MPCYCSRIRQLERELDDLYRAKQYVSDAIGESSVTVQYLAHAAGSFEAGFSLMQKQASIASEIQSAYRSAAGGMSRASSAVASAISHVRSTLSSLRTSDRDYHDRQRRMRDHGF